ncbi:DNA translocase FtsK 4TM domain-containing protein, partial [candidate division WOR-3 bacterium]|nr:DNA translocase FtsK 4TM domain-containing protein [candidate division WOR-3 bacterium]
MAKRTKRKANPTRSKSTRNSTSRPAKKKDNTDVIIGLLLLLLAVYLVISLSSFNPEGTFAEPLNWGGGLGVIVAGKLYEWLGVVAYLIPGLLILWGINRILRRPMKKLVLNTLLLVGFGFFLQVTLGFFEAPLYPVRNNAGVITESFSLGGSTGAATFRYFSNLMGKVGLAVVLIFLLLVSLVGFFGLNLTKVLSSIAENILKPEPREPEQKISPIVAPTFQDSHLAELL